jgi:hypothetical protein
MVASAESPSSRRMGRATLASLAVHAFAIALIPALAWTPTSGATVETVTFTRIAHIELQPRPRREQPRAVAPRRAPQTVISEASRIELAHTSRHRVASPPPAAIYRPSSAHTVAAAPRPGVGTSSGEAAPQPSATPVAREVSSAVGDNGGYLPFGAQQPDPVLDPGVRKQLDALGIHVTLVVTVGENGKTKSVEFQPPVDAQTENRIQSLLADANWDPAVCGGGISCEGRATIKL